MMTYKNRDFSSSQRYQYPARKRFNVNEALRADIRLLISQGKTVEQICEELGRKPNCIYAQLDRMGIKMNPLNASRRNNELTK